MRGHFEFHIRILPNYNTAVSTIPTPIERQPSKFYKNR